MNTLTLADGTILEGTCNENNNKLWVYLSHISLADAYVFLSNPAAMQTVVANEYGTITEYSGWTHLSCISEENGGNVSAVMKLQ